MDRLIAMEPSNEVVIRMEPKSPSHGFLTLRNLMHTMPVAFRLLALDRKSFKIKPQSSIIPPLSTATLKITYLHHNTIPQSHDSFYLDSVICVGDSPRSLSPKWFNGKKKQVFTDTSLAIRFVGLEKARANEVKMIEEWGERFERVTREDEEVMRAARRGDVGGLRGAMGRGGAADARDGRGWTAMMVAAIKGWREVVRVLAESGGEIDAREEEGYTALMVAVEAGRGEVVEELVARGADVGARTEKGRTAGEIATAMGYVGFVRMMERGGAKKVMVKEEGGKGKKNCDRVAAVDTGRGGGLRRRARFVYQKNVDVV